MNSEIINKIKTGIALVFSGMCGYLGIVQETLLILGVLVIIDFITGILKSYSIGKDITSKRGAIGILSKLLLILIPITLALVGKGAGYDLRMIVAFGTGALIMAEGYSILANIYMLITKQEVKEIDAVSCILKYALGEIQKILMRIMEDSNIKKN